jgi:hypothetical protein
VARVRSKKARAIIAKAYDEHAEWRYCKWRKRMYLDLLGTEVTYFKSVSLTAEELIRG